MRFMEQIPNPWPYYTGPFFNPRDAIPQGLGTYITTRRETCRDYFYRTYGRGPKQTDMVKCMLNNLDAATAANAASHTYLLTLWPAFISIIVALGPDGGQVAYDNILWSAVFSITSGAIPGSQSLSLPHHFNALTMEEAREICGYWQDDDVNPRKSSRRGRLRKGRHTSEMASLVLAFACIGLWIAFVMVFSIALRNAVYYSNNLRSLWGAIWYLAAAGPVVCKGLFRVALNNVELWEPIRATNESPSTEEVPNKSNLNDGIEASLDPLPKGSSTTQQPATLRPNISSFPRFSPRKFRTGLQTWSRIAYLQLTQQNYRILARPDEPAWLDMVVRYCYNMGQLALFAFGCICQGGILFMDTPTDYYLTVLLVFVTATPRLLWPHFWRGGRRGADLVVWYNPPF